MIRRRPCTPGRHAENDASDAPRLMACQVQPAACGKGTEATQQRIPAPVNRVRNLHRTHLGPSGTSATSASSAFCSRSDSSLEELTRRPAQVTCGKKDKAMMSFQVCRAEAGQRQQLGGVDEAPRPGDLRQKAYMYVELSVETGQRQQLGGVDQPPCPGDLRQRGRNVLT